MENETTEFNPEIWTTREKTTVAVKDMNSVHIQKVIFLLTKNNKMYLRILHSGAVLGLGDNIGDTFNSATQTKINQNEIRIKRMLDELKDRDYVFYDQTVQILTAMVVTAREGLH